MTRSRAEAARQDPETWLVSPQARALAVHELEIEQERRSREVQRRAEGKKANKKRMATVSAA